MELSRMKLGPATTYALAVENGYTGTLEQFIKDQRGPAGTTPHIGADGNWYIGETDTGVKAAGSDGKTPTIGENGNWWIGDEDTGIAAEGKAATIEIVGTETLEAGQSAAVEEAEGSTAQNRKYKFKVPQGAAGEAATVEITGIETLEPGQSATLTELEDSTAAHRKYKMGVPQGKQGDTGVGVPVPTAEDAGKVPVVNGDGTGYELGAVISAPAIASVGQTIVVKAVDENGKPTEWEAADAASGGDNWRLVKTINLEEEVQSIEFLSDENGDPYRLKKMLIVGSTVGAESNTSSEYLICDIGPVDWGDGTRRACVYSNGIGLSGAVRCAYVYTEIVGGWPQCYAASNGASGIGSTSAPSLVNPVFSGFNSIDWYMSKLSNGIQKIKLSCNAMMFGIGTHIEIWGVNEE